MYKRTSKVNAVNIISLGSASALQIGDSEEIQSTTLALAVQRQRELFFGDEGNLETYPVFNRLYPLSSTAQPVDFQTTTLHPIIKVNSVHVTAVVFSAVLHIGNTNQIAADTRIKHIRETDEMDNLVDPNTEEG